MTVATKRTVPTSGGRLAVVDVGEGPAVVLLHGFPLSSFLWRRFVPMLAGAFRVVAPDLLGAGDSDAPAGVALDIAAQAGYVREALDALGVDRCAVVGHGEGGGVAQRLAWDGFPVEALVLIDSIAFDARRADATVAGEGAAPPAARVERLLRDGMTSRPLDPDVLAGYTAPFEGVDGGAILARSSALLDPALAGGEETMAAWTIPVFLLWGEDDPIYPVELAERLNDAIPSSSLALLPGCGHYPPEEAPETVGPLITEYLRARYLKAPHAHAGDKEGVVMLQLERRPPWLDPEGDEEGEA